MPPRISTSNMTSSFAITDAANEVVCPLHNHDGSSCRKRCLGEKRYRSMQEHIRRAHPEHYIPKLPATEDSFHLMVTTTPRPQPPRPLQLNATSALTVDQARGLSSALGRHGSSAPGTPRNVEDYQGGSLMPVAAALAQLGHANKPEPSWDSEADWHSDTDGSRRPLSSIELPPIHLSTPDVTSMSYSGYDPIRDGERLPSLLNKSPPGRSSTLPPLHRPLAPANRPRQKSITKHGIHRRKRSKGTNAEWLRRIQNGGPPDLLRPGGHERKALSAEPSEGFGKRWEDLIDAAASANEEADEDRTPGSRNFPAMAVDPALTAQAPQSPVSIQRASLPPYSQHQHHVQPGNYQASPLQQAITPPNYNHEAAEPFQSVESGESGDNFHIKPRGLSDSSPSYSTQNTQIYCAACQGLSLLKESYACTECVCGLCAPCVEVLMSEQGARRKCPRCATIGGRFKPFQLDIR